MLADLHLHSNKSDGLAAWQELVRGLSPTEDTLLAFCDHHYLTLAEPWISGRLTVIPGIEISAQIDSQSIHLTAYGLHPHPTSQLKHLLDRLVMGYQSRAYKLLDNLALAGLDLEGPVRDPALPLPIYTLDIARRLQSKLRLSSVTETLAWAKTHGNLLFVAEEPFFPTAAEVISACHDSGLKVFWAHPGSRYFRSEDDLAVSEAVLSCLVSSQIDGLEAFSTAHTEEQNGFFVQKGIKHQLVISGGSDYHGRELGNETFKSLLPNPYPQAFLNCL